MAELANGTYRPNDSVTVTVWNEGDEPPAGFDIQQNSDGTRSAVKRERGDVVRGPDGSAASIPEGGALVEYPDGRYETLQDEDARNEFARRYLSSDAGSNTASAQTVNGPTGTGQVAGNPADTPGNQDGNSVDPEA